MHATLTRQYGEFISGIPYGEIPAEAAEYGKMLVASTLASAALGSTLSSSGIVRAQENDRGGRPEATTWFGGWESLPVVAAARINALMSDAAASDDSDLRNIVHSGTQACAAALAVGERTGASGQEVLAAVVLGYEVAGNINSAMIGGLQRKGFHGCVVATFAAAAAAARLLKLDADAAGHAMALAATSMGGLHAAAATSLAREYHAGNAAMMGVNSALAAHYGYTAEPGTFEMKRGFFETLGVGAEAAEIIGQLGEKWCILSELGIKLVPGGSPFHAVAEAAANAARRGKLDVTEIRRIDFTLPDYPFPGPKHPTDLIGIAHSPFYFAAAGAADWDYNWEHAFPQKIQDPRIRSLFDKVFRDDQDVANKSEYKSGAIVRIETVAGQTFEEHVRYPKGAALRGIGWREIESKYQSLMPYGAVSATQIAKSISVIRDLEKQTDVRNLISTLRPNAV